MRRLIVSIFLLVCSSDFLVAKELVFGKDAPEHVLQSDISISRVEIEAKGFFVGGFADYCLAVRRDKGPATYNPPLGRGGFSELICFNYVRTRDATTFDGAVPKPWRQEVDLSSSPLFLPAGTTIMCNSLGATRSDFPAGGLDGSCTLTYEDYVPNSPRSRMLRLPYMDMTFDWQHKLTPSFFSGWSKSEPLKISSVVVYAGNNFHDSSMEMCLTRSPKSDRTNITDQRCFPKSDEESAGQVHLDWTIDHDEVVGLNCKYPDDDKRSTGDCAAFLVVDVPSSLPNSAESVMREFGAVPKYMAQAWCKDTAETFATVSVHNPVLCKPGVEKCDVKEKMKSCLKAFKDIFPDAKCMKKSSCWRSPRSAMR